MDAQTHRVGNDEQASCHAAVELKARLAIVPAIVDLRPPVGIRERWDHIDERETALLTTAGALGIIPIELHYMPLAPRSMDESFSEPLRNPKSGPGF
jgi:hypothetical protein